MGGFFIIIKEYEHDNNLKQYNAERGLDVFNKKGLKLNKFIQKENFEVYTFYKRFHEKENTFIFPNGDFLITVGTFLYDGETGQNAVNELYNDLKKNKRFLLNKTNGQFAVISFVENELKIFNDSLGLYHIFFDDQLKIISNSFLAVSKSVINKEVSIQEIYEYIFNGATYGNKTVFKNINSIDRKEILTLYPRKNFDNKQFPRFDVNVGATYKNLIESVSDDLINYFRMIKNNFGNNVSSALSGGYDSRLMFAIMNKLDMEPQLYVSGNEKSSDIKVAQTISKHYNIPLEIYYEKNNTKLSPEEFYELIKFKFYLNDGISTKGLFLTTSQMDLKTTQNKLLNLNGGGGEIFRDFWKLINKRFTVSDFVTSRYDVALESYCTDKFNSEAYLSNLGFKIKKALDSEDEQLTRQEIDRIYPFFRMRFWMSAVNKRLNYLSCAIWPFAEWRLVEKSNLIPVKYKFFGKFEADLIKNISPEVAKFNSNYGYNFYDPLPVKYKIKEGVKYGIPVSLRPCLRKKKLKSNFKLPYYFQNEYREQFFDKESYFVSEYIDTSYPHFETVSRIFSLELLLKDAI